MHYAPCLQKAKKKFVENVGGVDGPPTCKDVATYLVDNGGKKNVDPNFAIMTYFGCTKP
jgi:hypothetical protein